MIFDQFKKGEVALNLGDLALHLAIHHDHFKIYERLMQEPYIDYETAAKNGFTPICTAFSKQRFKILTELKEHSEKEGSSLLRIVVSGHCQFDVFAGLMRIEFLEIITKNTKTEKPYYI